MNPILNRAFLALLALPLVGCSSSETPATAGLDGGSTSDAPGSTADVGSLEDGQPGDDAAAFPAPGVRYLLLSTCEPTLLVGVEGTGTVDGQLVTLQTRPVTPYDTQQFKLSPHPAGHLRIAPVSSATEVLDIYGQSPDPGAVVQLWTFSDSVVNQGFELELQSDGSYRIKAPFSGLYLQVKGTTPGSGVTQEPLADSCTQRFRFEELPADAPAPGPPSGNTINSIQTIIDDMQQPAEGHISTTYQSYAGHATDNWPVMSGPKPAIYGAPSFHAHMEASRVAEIQDFYNRISSLALIVQLWAAKDVEPPPNVVVEMRNFRLQVLRNGVWEMVGTWAVGGACKMSGHDSVCTGDSSAYVSKDATGQVFIVEPPTPIGNDPRGYEFWSRDPQAAPADTPVVRPVPDFKNVEGIVVSVEVRLAKRDPAQPATFDEQAYLAAAKYDIWADPISCPNGGRYFADGVPCNVADSAAGRMKYITTEWRAFNVASLTDYSGTSADWLNGYWEDVTSYVAPFVLQPADLVANPPQVY